MADQLDRTGSFFEERAEYLTRDQLLTWSALPQRERKVVAKLKGTGAKLLIGPRGSGKSTLLRVAYFELLESDDVLPVYVNYAKHLALEPMFHSRPDASELFRQWVVCKVVLGLADTAAETGLHLDSADWDSSGAHEFVDALETGREPRDSPAISPTRLLSMIAGLLQTARRKRAVLLFDDAAHAFSPQQQREFFEIFRQLRSRTVAPKAAVYPGVTNYSSNMHIGHDAELVEAWYRSDDKAFFQTMEDVLERRLPDSLRAEFTGEREELLKYLALASFGLPRSFLNMVRDVLDYDEDTQKHVTPTKRRADDAISRNVANVRHVFESTGVKIPRYLNLITEGRTLESSFLTSLQKFNLSKRPGLKTITVGVKRPLSREFEHVTDLMEYAGIVRHLDAQSRGQAGVFERYDVHPGFVIDSNSLALGRSPSVADVVKSLTIRPANGLVRGRPESFLGEDYRDRCTLNLTPCANCGAARVSEDAQFCMRCGRPLTEKSIYHEILRLPIGELPIPEKKKQALEKTKLETIQDVLLDVDFTELLRGRYVGPIWAQRIFSAAEEFVSV
jgi:hypothetical protein